MSLNRYVETPMLGTFTLEDLGLGQTKDDHTHTNTNDEGVLGEQKPDAPEAIIVADNATPGPHDTTLSQNEIEAIPSWDVKIRLLKEHADKIVDMKDVQKDIEGTGKINRQHSDVIQATFENFYSPRNAAVMYTTFESLTNFSVAKNFMDKKIATSMEAFVTEYEEVNTNTASEMAQDLLKARDFCIYELRDMVNDAVSRIQAVCQRLCQAPIILPFKDGQFLDMTNQDYTQLDIANVDNSVPLSQEFINAYGKMVGLWKSSSKLRNFINESMCIHRAENPDSITPDVNNGLYLATILCSFGSWASDVMYSEYVQAGDRQVEGINNLREELHKATQLGGVSPESIISDRGGELVKLATEAAGMQGAAKELGEFTKACSVVAVGLASLR